MSVGMVPLPVTPVKAPSPNSCPSPPKPFACHTSAKSLKLSTPLGAATTHREVVPGCANSFTHISFADPHPLNSVVSYRCKNRGGRGSKLPELSFSSNGNADLPIGALASKSSDIPFCSNLPNSPEDSYSQKLAAQNSGFVILKPKGGLSTCDETSHLYRSVPEHCATHLGLHQRHAPRQIRFVLHGPLAVRRTIAHRPGRHRHHPRHRIRAHPRSRNSAGPFHCFQKDSAQSPPRLEIAGGTIQERRIGCQLPQHASADADSLRRILENRSRVLRDAAGPGDHAEESRRRVAHRRSRSSPFTADGAIQRPNRGSRLTKDSPEAAYRRLDVECGKGRRCFPFSEAFRFRCGRA